MIRIDLLKGRSISLKLHSLSELCDMSFDIKYLAASGTADDPTRRFRCLRDQRKFDRFFYIKEGRYLITQDGCEPLRLTAGDIIYLPSDCVYTSEWLSEDIAYRSVQFILTDGDGPFSFSENIFCVAKGLSKGAGEIMSRLVSVWTRGELGHKLKAASIFYDLLHCIALEELNTALVVAYSDISDAIIYLKNNYSSDVSTAELARLCMMSESRFRQKFTEYAGMPPIRYRNYLRIKQAAELIAGGEYTVGEAAELVGINDTAYFNRLFHMFMGTNPSSFGK